jgi:hypothetical protein
MIVALSAICMGHTIPYLESLRLGRAARKRLYEYTLVYPSNILSLHSKYVPNPVG